VQVLAAPARHLSLDRDLLPALEAIGRIPEAMKLAMRLRQRRRKGRLVDLAGGRLVKDILVSLGVGRDLGTRKGLGQAIIVLANGREGGARGRFGRGDGSRHGGPDFQSPLQVKHPVGPGATRNSHIYVGMGLEKVLDESARLGRTKLFLSLGLQPELDVGPRHSKREKEREREREQREYDDRRESVSQIGR
jgi:hypothetical protein